jgi:hypothetical protein
MHIGHYEWYFYLINKIETVFTLLPYTPEYIFPYNFNIPPNKIHENDIKKMEYINEQLTCYMRLKKITFNCWTFS